MLTLYTGDEKIKQEIYDTMYELGNIGSGMACVVLGNMLRRRVYVSAPRVMTESENIAEHLIFGENDEVVGILSHMEAPMEGALLQLMHKEYAKRAVWLMTKKMYSEEALFSEEEPLSAIKEAANMMGAASMKAMGKYSDSRIYLTQVTVRLGAPRALIEGALNEMGERCRCSICVVTKYSAVEEDTMEQVEVGHTLMFPGVSSVERLMKALG